MCGYGGEIPGLISNPEHSHRKRRKEIGIGQGIRKTPTIAHLIVHALDRGDETRLGDDIAEDFERGRQRHTIRDQKAERPNNPRCAPVTHRSGKPRDRADGSHDASSASAVHCHEPDAEHGSQANAEKQIEIAAQPVGGAQNKGRTRIQAASQILEHRLELRHDVDQKEQQNDDGRRDQEQRVADRRIETLDSEAPRRVRSSTMARNIASSLPEASPARTMAMYAGSMTVGYRSNASAKLLPAEMDERSALANCDIALLVSSASVCSVPSRVSPAPTRRASWRRKTVTSRDRRQLPAAPTGGEDSLRCRLGLYREVAQIFDASDDLLARGSIDFADDDLSCLRKSAIAELGHLTRLQTCRYAKDLIDSR